MSKDVLFEIGVEELPARFIDDVEKQLLVKTKKWLSESRISFDQIQSYSTPRRLAVKIKKINDTQTSLDTEVKGPAEKVAKDQDGNWTKAAIGFTKGQGKTVDDIYIKELKGTPYIHIQKHIEGQPTINLLPEFKSVIQSLQFPGTMKWGEETTRFARPIRWLVALYDSEVIPFELASVQTNNITYGHRFLGDKIILATPLDYEKTLYNNYVIVNAEKRKSMIKEGIQNLEKKNKYSIVVDPQLLDEVKNLVEYPTVFMGSFNPKYLDLPEEVLITSMKEHQRYFHVQNNEGELLPYFVSVRNGDSHAIEQVARGNEKVLHARLADAQFFYEEDQKQSIDYYQTKLENVVFQEKLGTISDKTKRVKAIAEKLVAHLSISKENAEAIDRAAEICKFDLTTNMVNEFTELQGIIGEKYAKKFGEDRKVAQAIREHYLPDHANGDLPQSIVGAVVSVADKLDTIVGSIYIGLKPTSSQDPYGLRRQAIGILRIVKDWNWNFSIKELVEIPLSLLLKLDLANKSEDEVKHQVIEFMDQRIQYLLKERHIEPDIIQAVLNKGTGKLSYLLSKATLLSSKRNETTFRVVQEALVRVLNVAKEMNDTNVNPSLFEKDSELQLYDVLQKVRTRFESFDQAEQAEKALEELSHLAKPIHQFFEENMVMDKNEALKNNRLALMYNISQLILNYADLREIEWKQNF